MGCISPELVAAFSAGITALIAAITASVVQVSRLHRVANGRMLAAEALVAELEARLAVPDVLTPEDRP